MATSPPYNQPAAISPPYPSSTTLPQSHKRRQSDMPTSGPQIKRRKASVMSITSASSLHPLRQTSFPPEASSATTPRYSRSPSADNMSMISGSAAGPPNEKKRKRKSGKGTKGDDDESNAGGNKKARAGKDRRRNSRDETVEEEDEGPEGDTAIQKAVQTQEEKKRELEHKAMLVNALDPDQFSRYEAWRSSKFADSVVRRIVNQTLSQSAPASVILAVRSAAKIFAGEIIEGSRKVQSEFVEASGESQTTGLPLTPPAEGEEPREKETRRGPLLPEHMREAYRRHKLERSGGMTGQLGLWQVQASSGVERFGPKVGGKRLFK